jgi:hypothetical protein
MEVRVDAYCSCYMVTSHDHAHFTVERPELGGYTTTKGVVQILSGNTLRCGKLSPTAERGMTYRQTLTGCSSFAGKVKFVQRVNVHRHWKKFNSEMDTFDPYAASLVWNLPQSATIEPNCSDSPGNTLGDAWSWVDALDSFEMYLMFQPTVTDPSIWVPLTRLPWSWKGYARVTTDGWELDPAKTSEATLGSVVDTLKFPEWSQRASATVPRPAFQTGTSFTCPAGTVP